MESNEVLSKETKVKVDKDNSVPVTSSKKAEKKTVRALAILKKDTGIEESPEVTRILFICNADLYNVFSKYGPVEQIILIPKKSYSFVIFLKTEDAKLSYYETHGKTGFSDRGPLYLAFVDKPPTFEDPWKDREFPPGLKVIPDFISTEEEEVLLNLFNWDTSSQENVLKHRQVKHFGYEFNYSTNDIDPDLPLDDPIPSKCMEVAEKALDLKLSEHLVDQMTVNRYMPGQGIPPHVDSHSCARDGIMSLSLSSGVVMTFRDPGGRTVPVWLPRRSLLVMSGAARYTWSHGITPRHYDTLPCRELGKDQDGLTLVNRDIRVSLTFRKTLAKTSRPRGPRTSLEEAAGLLERQLVHSVYEEIASHFSDTRHKPWPRVTEFLSSLPAWEPVLDLGCGNGKYLGLSGPRWEVGADYSHNLLQISSGRGHQAIRCDILSVPVRDRSCGGLICIAALHHLATPSRRLAALSEMSRVLMVGGRGLVYVWAKDQQRESNMSSYLKQNKKNMKAKDDSVTTGQSVQLGEFGLPVHVNRTQFQHQDVLVPWKLKQTEEEGGDKEFKRFYHVFESGELEALVEQVECLKVTDSYYDQGNWCCIFEKVQ